MPFQLLAFVQQQTLPLEQSRVPKQCLRSMLLPPPLQDSSIAVR
jgi:hypothetical protein